MAGLYWNHCHQLHVDPDNNVYLNSFAILTEADSVATVAHELAVSTDKELPALCRSWENSHSVFLYFIYRYFFLSKCISVCTRQCCRSGTGQIRSKINKIDIYLEFLCAGSLMNA
jgi:hypothetical protein